MASVFRGVGSIIVGFMLALILIIAVELMSNVVHPVPPGFNGTKEEMCKHVENYSGWVLALVVPAWSGTTLVSTWVTRRLGNRGSAALVGVVLFAAVVFNVSMLPYPTWFKVAMPMSVAVGIYLALRSGLTDPVESAP